VTAKNASISNPGLGDLTDREVVELLARDDQGALAELYDRYRSLVMALTLRILSDPADAEEVLQETFFQVWRQAGRYNPERSSVSTWLVLIARSRALDRKRRQTTAARTQEKLRAEPLDADTSPEGGRRVLWRERRERLTQVLSELPPEQREALELAYYGGMTQNEVAERTDTPLGTVKTRTMLALRKLRKALDSDIRELL
jgi:RNA polymerase sigma-70 factor (ECF subfamily)